MKLNNEIKIGVMVTVVVLILFGLTIKSGKFNFSSKGYNVLVDFNNVDGVNLNSPVMLNGFEVGLVQDIKIKEEGGKTKIELILWLKDAVKIHRNTKAIVKLMGFMGEKYVGLIAGNEGPYLQNGDMLVGQDPTNFEDLVKNGTEISLQVKEITQRINQLLADNGTKINSIMTNANDTVKNVSSISANLDQRLKVNEQNVDVILGSMRGVAVNLEEMSSDLKKNPWKILYKGKEK
ncbi:MAG: MCE family protein [Candidatus Omnitrophica bacterium]|nr:MCE family protein [Candidatus Omnitrophota bacterium]